MEVAHYVGVELGLVVAFQKEVNGFSLDLVVHMVHHSPVGAARRHTTIVGGKQHVRDAYLYSLHVCERNHSIMSSMESGYAASSRLGTQRSLCVCSLGHLLRKQEQHHCFEFIEEVLS